MIRRATVLSFALALGAGTALFVVKHEVQKLEEDLGRITRATLADQEAVHVLKAEWSYLNEPSRLQRLAEKHLDLKPVTAQRLVDLDSLPWRRGPTLAESVADDRAPTDRAPGEEPRSAAPPFPPELPMARARHAAARIGASPETRP
ncbi:MAG: hypothetical protein U1E97_05935 [Alphaproteobacteria bacterium]